MGHRFRTRARYALLACLLRALLTAPPVQGAVGAPQASAAADPLAELVRQVREKPEAWTYSRMAVAAGREIYPALNEERAAKFEKDLDDLAEALKAELKKTHGKQEAVACLNRLLFDRAKLQTVRDSVPGKERADHYFPHAVLEKKEGVCLGLSLVYLALGERAGLPLAAVHAPQHIYVRLDDGRECLNIETTDRGRVFDETALPVWKQLSPEVLKRRTFFHALGKLEVLGDLLNAASWCSAIGTAARPLPPERAVLAGQLCVELGPEDYGNWDTLARAEQYAGRPRHALATLRTALAMHPPNVGVYDQKYWEARLMETTEALEAEGAKRESSSGQERPPAGGP